MKTTSLLVLLSVLAVSCGNPHLTKDDLSSANKPNSGLVTPISVPTAGPNKNIITVDNKVPFGDQPQGPIVSKDLPITSNADEDVPFELKWEKGKIFEVNRDKCNLNLKAKKTCHLTILFVEQTPGYYADKLIITPKNGEPQNVFVNGNRTKVEKSVVQLLSDSGSELDFGTLFVNNKLTKKITVTNSYKKPFHLLKLIQNPNEDFSIKHNCPANLTAASCEISVTFSPRKIQSYTSKIELTGKFDGEDKVTESFPVRGMSVSRPSYLSVPKNINFGTVPKGQLINRTIPIKSTANKPIVINVQIKNGEHFNFNETNHFPGKNGTCKDNMTLNPNESCLLDLNFDEKHEGYFSDDLIISSPDSEPAIGTLEGTRIKTNRPSEAPKLQIKNENGNTLDFGKIFVKSISSKVIVLENPFDAPFHLSKLFLLPADKKEEALNHIGAFEIKNHCGDTIKRGNCTIEIIFSPKDVSEYKVMLAIEGQYQDQNDSRYVLNVTGTAVARPTKKCFSAAEVPAKTLTSKLTDLENEVVFPYLFNSKGTKRKLTEKYGTEFSKKTLDNIPVIEDAQVLTQFKIENISMSQTLEDIKLKMHLLKIKNPNGTYNDTEMLCISTKTLKKCSGHLFRDIQMPEWFKLKNTAFFGTADKSNKYYYPANALYENKLASTSFPCGRKTCEGINEEISLKEMLQLDATELDLLKKEQVWNLILTDDTRQIEWPSIKIITKEDVSCN